jgi:hypothetical protein
MTYTAIGFNARQGWSKVIRIRRPHAEGAATGLETRRRQQSRADAAQGIASLNVEIGGQALPTLSR